MIRQSVIFDVGKVLFDWDLRYLFAKLIDDPAELEWFVTHVVTAEWHFQHDAGRPLAEMVPERKAEFPAHGALIDAYATRFNETIPGPVPGSLDLVARLDAAGCRCSRSPISGMNSGRPSARRSRCSTGSATSSCRAPSG